MEVSNHENEIGVAVEFDESDIRKPLQVGFELNEGVGPSWPCVLGCMVFFRMCIKVRDRVGTNEPKDIRTPILPIHAAFRRRKSFLWKPCGFFR